MLPPNMPTLYPWINVIWSFLSQIEGIFPFPRIYDKHVRGEILLKLCQQNYNLIVPGMFVYLLFNWLWIRTHTKVINFGGLFSNTIFSTMNMMKLHMCLMISSWVNVKQEIAGKGLLNYILLYSVLGPHFQGFLLALYSEITPRWVK